MAKSKKEKSSDDQEMKEIKKRQAERDKKRKLRRVKKKKKLKKETKKINKIINMPFKLLFQLSLLGSSLSFIILYFGGQTALIKSLYYSFLVFSFLSLGVGCLMIVIFYFISEQKKLEIEMAKRKDEEDLKRHVKEREEFMTFDSDVLEPVSPPAEIANETDMGFEAAGIPDTPKMAASIADTSFDMEMPEAEVQAETGQQTETETIEKQFTIEQNQAVAEPHDEMGISLEDMMESELPEGEKG